MSAKIQCKITYQLVYPGTLVRFLSCFALLLRSSLAYSCRASAFFCRTTSLCMALSFKLRQEKLLACGESVQNSRSRVFVTYVITNSKDMRGEPTDSKPKK